MLDASTIHLFQIRHLVSQVRGRFNAYSGTIQMDPKNLANSSVEFRIKAESAGNKLRWHSGARLR